MSDTSGALVLTGPTDLLATILSMSKDKDLNIAVFQALMSMQERLEARQAERAFNEAFYAMEAEIPRIRKDGTVEYKRKGTEIVEKAFKFATWDAIDANIRPILRRFGFALSFDSAPSGSGGLIVVGTLLHTGGHSRTASIALALDGSGGKNNIQGAGSTASYGKRYTTTMLLNIVTEGDDDDGHKGGLSFLTDEQVVELQDLMRQTATNEQQFLRGIGFEDLHAVHELESRAFAQAKNALLGKLRRQNQQQAGAT